MTPPLIPQSRPTIGAEESKAVDEVLTSGYLAMGPMVTAFEKEFAEFIGTRYAVAVNSGTSALHLSLLAVGIKSETEVIVPSYACPALLNAVRYTGACPVIVDIDPKNFCLSFEDTSRKITSRTAAIIAVHTFGMPADIAAFSSLGVPVIEDFTHSIGGDIGDKRMGSVGAVAMCSFYPTKMITTGEGGMLFTASNKILSIARNLRTYNISKSYAVRYNYKMSDIAAAIGKIQLSKLGGFIQKRRSIAKHYDSFFRRWDNITVPDRNPESDVFYRYIILLPDKGSADNFKNAMCKEGIICDSPVERPLHQYLDFPDEEFSGTLEVFNRTVSIPIYPSLTDKGAKTVLDTCKNILVGLKHLKELTPYSPFMDQR